MPVNEIDNYLKSVESAFNSIDDGYIESYEEEIITGERCNLRVRVRYSNGSLLEWNEAVVFENSKLVHLGYRYHYQDKNNNLIFRYDNTPHFPDLDKFPCHKHCPDHVDGWERPEASDVINEIEKTLI